MQTMAKWECPMTGRSSKAKGYGAENAVVKYLRENGYPYAERRRAGASKDTGDIVGVSPGLILEVKNHARLAIPEWLRQLDDERDVFDPPAWAGTLVIKPRGVTDVGEWWSVMRFRHFLELIDEVEKW